MDNWTQVVEFDKYDVSDLGEVRNSRTLEPRRLFVNAQDLVCVTLYQGPKAYTRSVAKLVAEAWLEAPPRGESYSPWHIDGDRYNNAAYNLRWRPRGLVKLLTSQAKQGGPRDPRPVMLVNTNEIFESAWHLGMQYGVLETTVLNAAGDPNAWRIEGSKVIFVKG